MNQQIRKYFGIFAFFATMFSSATMLSGYGILEARKNESRLEEKAEQTEIIEMNIESRKGLISINIEVYDPDGIERCTLSLNEEFFADFGPVANDNRKGDILHSPKGLGVLNN